MPLLEKKVVGCRCSIMLISKQTFFCVLRVIPNTSSFSKNIRIDRNGMPANKNAMRWRMIIKTIKFMSPDLSQSQSFCVCRQ